MRQMNDNKYLVPEGMPPPDSAAIEHSETLRSTIKREIATTGSIAFSRYMQLALYAPGAGYYSAGAQKLGSGGDFITAPEISPLFSRCIARQCAQVLGTLDEKNIIEFGAGSGRMAIDILLELESMQCLPHRYRIIDTSAELKQRQQQAIAQHIPHLAHLVDWLDQLPDNDSLEGIVLANEVLDAMPVELFRMTDNGPRDVHVRTNDNGFELVTSAQCNRQVRKRLENTGFDFAAGYESEVNLAADAWIASIASVLSRGLILLIDYGYPQYEYYHHDRMHGTLMCFYQHRSHTDPLVLTGLQDITAHVDFTAIAESAHDNGLNVSGFTTQAFFLLGCGLESMSIAENKNDAVQQLEINSQIKKLTLPSEMGERFKVMALTKQLPIDLMGFSLSDQRARLAPKT